MALFHKTIWLAVLLSSAAPAWAEEAKPVVPAEEREASVRTLKPGQIPLPLPRLAPRRKNYDPREEYRMPDFDPAWGLDKKIYDQAAASYEYWSRDLENNRFVAVVDLGQESSARRFYLFDLQANRMDNFLTTHGKNSDPKNDGIGREFSNEEDSLKSSLGQYVTLNAYVGEHGYSLRLRGLDDSNSNAEDRAVVIHSALYVSELNSAAGRSWGCLVLDPIISRAIIDRLKGGALIYVGSSYTPPPKKDSKKEKADGKGTVEVAKGK